MSVNKFITAFREQFPDLTDEQNNFMNEYLENEKAQYLKNKDECILNFGKYKGFSIKKLSEDPKGKDYIQWLLSQSSFVENPRNKHLLDAINECNIKKKMNKAL
jgi:hypothetical protein